VTKTGFDSLQGSRLGSSRPRRCSDFYADLAIDHITGQKILIGPASSLLLTIVIEEVMFVKKWCARIQKLDDALAACISCNDIIAIGISEKTKQLA
jgi:hypothetical protein